MVTDVSIYSKVGVQSCHGPFAVLFYDIVNGDFSVLTARLFALVLELLITNGIRKIARRKGKERQNYMYQALYRKWRPRTFDDVVGQEHVTETLKNQIISGRLSHAYLFIGTRGTGKTSCAKILARAVNCEHTENGNPCNKCRSCIGIEDGSIPDVVELDAASNNGVDNVRALRDEAVFSPVAVKKRVYIIDEVHMLSTSAFNALLKILEEPPEHLMFILATTELHKVPATILSRCQRHSFKRIDSDAMTNRLIYVAEQENLRLEPNAASLLARLSDGSLRDGLSLLDQCSGNDTITAESVLSAMGLAGNLRIAQLLNLVADRKTGDAISLFGEMWHDGKAPVTLLSELNTLLRDILMIKVAPKGGRELLSGNFDMAALSGLAKRMTPEELICNIDAIQMHIGSMRDGRDPKTTAELCLIGLCEPELGDSIDTLKKRIAKLETLVQSGTVQATQQHPNVLEDRVKSVYQNDDKHPLNTEKHIEEQPNVSKEDINSPQLAELNDNTAIIDYEPPFDVEEGKNKTESELNKDSEENKGYEEPAEKDVHDCACSEDLWNNILSELKKTMLQGQFNLLSNSQMAKGVLEGDALKLLVSNSFAKGQLEQSAVMDCIRQAAQNVVGRAVMVKIEENSENQTVNTEKLNDLTKFGNVKFE